MLCEKPNFELRDRSPVVKVNLDSTGKRATGVTYIDAQGRTSSSPRISSIVCAFQMHNVRLLLLSGIGKPYDPATGEGMVGKNYAYQKNSNSHVFFDKDVAINPFIGAGSAAACHRRFQCRQLRSRSAELRRWRDYLRR